MTCEGQGRVLRRGLRLHNLAHRQAELEGKVIVPGIMGWNSHDGPTAVAAQHVVSHPDGHRFLVHWVPCIAACAHTPCQLLSWGWGGGLGCGERRGTCSTGFVGREGEQAGGGGDQPCMLDSCTARIPPPQTSMSHVSTALLYCIEQSPGICCHSS